MFDQVYREKIALHLSRMGYTKLVSRVWDDLKPGGRLNSRRQLGKTT